MKGGTRTEKSDMFDLGWRKERGERRYVLEREDEQKGGEGGGGKGEGGRDLKTILFVHVNTYIHSPYQPSPPPPKRYHLLPMTSLHLPGLKYAYIHPESVPQKKPKKKKCL